MAIYSVIFYIYRKACARATANPLIAVECRFCTVTGPIPCYYGVRPHSSRRDLLRHGCCHVALIFARNATAFLKLRHTATWSVPCSSYLISYCLVCSHARSSPRREKRGCIPNAATCSGIVRALSLICVRHAAAFLKLRRTATWLMSCSPYL